MVVDQAAVANQTFDAAPHPRQTHQTTQRSIFLVRLQERRAGRYFRNLVGAQQRSIVRHDGLHGSPVLSRRWRLQAAGFVEKLLVDVRRHAPVEAQQAMRREVGHLHAAEPL